MDDAESVRQVVEDLVRDRFSSAEIISVSVREELDFDDDRVLRVQVVFKTPNQRLDARTTSSFLRHLRPKLSEIGVHMFPVMSFVSERDVSGAAA